MRIIIKIFTKLILVSYMACPTSCNTKIVSVESSETINEIIDEYDASTDKDKIYKIIDKALNDTSYIPQIHLVFENIDTLMEISYADSITIKYSDKRTKQTRISVKEAYSSNSRNIKQLIGSINPLSCPYFFGDNVYGDGAFLIKIDDTIIVIDMDISKSIIPYDLLQIYKYICFDVSNEVNLPPVYLQ